MQPLTLPRSGWLFLALCCASIGFAANPGPKDDFRKAALPLLASPVYPFEALRDGRAGKVELECILNNRGELVSATVAKSDGPEFSGAALAYADDMNFFFAGAQMKPGQELVQYNLVVEFKEAEAGAKLKPLGAPTKSAIKLIEQFRKDPSGKFLTAGKALDNKLEVVSQKAPVFPRQLQDKTDAGSATVEFCVDETGNVELPRVISATDPAFGYAACQSVSSWKFKPPLKAGKPVATKVRVPVNFKLNAAKAK